MPQKDQDTTPKQWLKFALDIEDHTRFKVVCIKLGVTMQEQAAAVVRNALPMMERDATRKEARLIKKSA